MYFKFYIVPFTFHNIRNTFFTRVSFSGVHTKIRHKNVQKPRAKNDHKQRLELHLLCEGCLCSLCVQNQFV